MNSLAWTADSIDVTFDVMRSGETYTFDINPVPEPATLVLFALGAAGLGLARRRRS